MTALLMTVVLTAASPVVLRVEMQDALRLPNGFVTPPADPLTLYVKAPASWASQGAITEAGKQAVLAKMYGGPGWMNGNSDGSTYVVKKFSSKVLASAAEATDGKSTWWYEVKADGALDTRGPGFGPPAAPKKPESFIDHAEKGSVFKQGPRVTDAKALVAWLDKQTAALQLPVVLGRGKLGWDTHAASVGTLQVRCDDSALGISLDDRATQECGDTPTCALWLEGRWKGGKERVFAVTKVVRAIGPNDRELRLDEHAMYNVPN